MKKHTFPWNGQSLRRIVVALAGPALLLAPATVTAQDAPVYTEEPYPVAIHEGSCTDLTAEPLYDLGALEPRPQAGFEVDAGTPILSEDADNDGVLASEEDLDSDGVLDYGYDLNLNENLEVEELSAAPAVWSLQVDFAGLETTDDPEAADFRSIPHAMVIHDGLVTDDDYLACGEIAGVSVDGEVVVPLRPVNDDGMAAVAIMEEGSDGFLGIGDSPGEIEIHAWPRQVPFAPDAVGGS